jgi:hypothetical protein
MFWGVNIYLLAYSFNYMHFEQTHLHVEGQIVFLKCYPLNVTKGCNIVDDVLMHIFPVFKDSYHFRAGGNLSVMISESRNIVIFVNLNCAAFCKSFMSVFHLPQYKITHSHLLWLISYQHPARN